ncbi:hypothetical protein CCH79_00019007 [Gambusia affinis]|uniref:Uncharacterized protein n=1 Tax=Gambusia affinis TaxID=33528 RepID=A0A315VZC2_GAMAF|nr:hypothetical protein CCH79_00019007 [Gambusia affinis]
MIQCYKEWIRTSYLMGRTSDVFPPTWRRFFCSLLNAGGRSSISILSELKDELSKFYLRDALRFGALGGELWAVRAVDSRPAEPGGRTGHAAACTDRRSLLCFFRSLRLIPGFTSIQTAAS